MLAWGLLRSWGWQGEKQCIRYLGEKIIADFLLRWLSSPDMRRELEEKALDGVTVREGRAEDLQVSEEWAQGVIVAQAFHWFATEEALGEMHRVLQPGGVLGMIWNIDDCEFPHPHRHTSRVP